MNAQMHLVTTVDPLSSLSYSFATYPYEVPNVFRNHLKMSQLCVRENKVHTMHVCIRATFKQLRFIETNKRLHA